MLLALGENCRTVSMILGSVQNLADSDDDCAGSHAPTAYAGVIGAPSSVTSIQVANLLKLFRIPQVNPV